MLKKLNEKVVLFEFHVVLGKTDKITTIVIISIFELRLLEKYKINITILQDIEIDGYQVSYWREFKLLKL